jgi:tetrahydromethanopterin S-methyltransferase subunit G
MEKMKIPKFENDADEANWAHERREELAANVHSSTSPGATGARLAARSRVG